MITSATPAAPFLACLVWEPPFYQDNVDERVHARLATDPHRSLCDKLIARDLPYVRVARWGLPGRKWCRRCALAIERWDASDLRPADVPDDECPEPELEGAIMLPYKRTPQEQQHLADEWNRNHPPGTAVLYHSVLPPGPSDTPRLTTTRSAASVLGGHTAVVFVDGVSGCVALSHVQPAPVPEAAAAS